ncbi:pre-rRNA-processing protein pno1 [Pleurotus pulmonarius]|nr:pre-rRNA-processing protein pno1 [Pleurotus pulmonarius]KAF4578939.1 pre-rRNA-processing protein pno1 [Pleurotus pulmonarius]KAF4603731.1 pre-rRNA-processing protein pno1 [Pleurotus pulmonarius]KAF4608556.1 pre-rRNA-processing protein pno1 [Pleurotus pulmonarius]
MGVTHIAQGTASSASGPRKNRRRTTKKAPRLADLQHNDVDEQMDDLDPKDKPDVPEASGSGDKSTPDDDDEIVIDEDASSIPQPSTLPAFAPLPANADKTTLKSEIRRIPIPPHRMTPIKVDWINIFGPLTEILGLQVRMNVQRRSVEIRTSRHTKDIGALQKGADFVKAYALGFDVKDAIALLRLDDLYLDSFEIKDVKTLHGDHLSRAIGRIAGQDGKTKFTIENASRTRIVLADTKIHIMGSFQNIKIARDAIVSLILGSPPGKVYSGLRTVSSRMRQRAL